MFSLHIRDRLYPDVAELIGRLEVRRGEIAADMAGSLRREVPSFGESALRHCLDHVDAYLRSARSGRAPAGVEVVFVREVATLQAREGVELETLLRAYRVVPRTVTFWLGESTRAEAGPLRAALALARMVMEYTDSVSAALAEAYLVESQRLLAASGSLQRDLLENLLAGRTGPAQEARARAAGLAPERDLQVAVVAAPELTRAAEAVTSQLAMARLRAVSVIRQDELVLLAAGDAPLRSVLERAAEAVPLRAGIGLLAHGLEEVGQAHREAGQALALSRARQVTRLSDLGLLDYLVAAGNDTARRLAPASVAQLNNALRQTVLAFAECDLNAGRAAEHHLHLHPNTVHYRLGRVEKITGLSTRRFRDLVDLVAAIRLEARAEPR